MDFMSPLLNQLTLHCRTLGPALIGLVAAGIFFAHGAAHSTAAEADSRFGEVRVHLPAGLGVDECSRKRIALAADKTDPMIPEKIDCRTPDMTALEAEWFERLDAALAALPEEQRLMFVLVELQGVSYQEAADLTEVSIGTVKSRLFRAKSWLREILEPVAPEGNRAAAAPSHQNL